MCVYACVCTCAPCHACTEVRKQLAGSNSVLFFGISRLNAGHQVCWQVLLPAEPSCWPLENIFECQLCMSFHVNIKSINTFKYLINKVQKSHSSRCLSSDEDKKEAK